jgi:DNA polymerase III subunit delta
VAVELKPVYLLFGSDRPKIEQALRRLRARVGESAVEVLSATESSGGDVVAACNAAGLFEVDGRAVVVVDVERWKAADVKAVGDYLADPAPATVLALVGVGLKRESPLAKVCAKTGELLVFDVSKSKLPAWVAQRFADLGANVDRDASRLLVELVGENVTELDTEITKLATWAGGETVDAAAVEALAAGRAEIPIFDLTDAWGAREAGAALAASEAILERSGGSRSSEITRIVGRLANHVQRVREGQALAAEGLSARQAASQMKKSPYYVQKLFAQAANFSSEELEDVLVRLAALELAVKGGSRLAPELELDRALVETTRSRVPGGSAQR